MSIRTDSENPDESSPLLHHEDEPIKYAIGITPMPTILSLIAISSFTGWMLYLAYFDSSFANTNVLNTSIVNY